MAANGNLEQRLDGVQRRRLVVLGGGLVGMAAAEAAARLGGDRVRVELYEAAAVGHPGGASIDVNRVLRHAHGDEAHYTRWSIEAVGHWRDLEERSGRTLLLQSGMLWMVHADDRPFLHGGLERPLFGAGLSFLQASQRTMQALGLRCELLDGAEVRRRYPLYADPGLGTTLLDAEAGVLMARDSVIALRDLAVRQGVAVHEQMRAVRVRPTPGACAVEFADGSGVEADAVLLAVNGWTQELLLDLDARLGADRGAQADRARLGLHVTEQPVYHTVPRREVYEQFLPDRFPIAAFLNTRFNIFPATAGVVKVSCDDGSRLIGSPDDRRLAPAPYRDEMLAYLEQQVPALQGAAVVQERACFYDRSPDDDFILDQWDPDARLILACGFSRHGFKFGPLLGDRLARYCLTGHPTADLAHFRLSRFAHGAPPPDPAALPPGG
jgi:glycine/D-amino acid oxidase-like deaminating enzyme